VSNDGYPASLERRKIYVALRDADAGKHGLMSPWHGYQTIFPRLLRIGNL
jgi:hypothetical protein